MRKIISVLYLFCSTFCLSPLYAQLVTFTANDATVSCESGSFCVNIEVSNFDSVAGIQYSYEWDPSIIQLDNYTDALPALGVFNESEVPNGILQYSWTVLNSPFYVNLPDGSSIIELCFIPVNTGNTSIDFGPIINSTIEIIVMENGQPQVVPANFNEGTAQVQDNSDPTITCPSDTMIVSSGTNVNNIAPVNFMDNCGVPSVSYNMVMNAMNVGSGNDDASGEFFTTGTTTVTYTATDDAGNTGTCNFDVVLTAPPVSDTILQFIPEVNIDCETGTVSIDVKVINFDSMTGMQWGMRWDEMVLDFINVDNFLPAQAQYNDGLESGAIWFTWFSAGPPFYTTLPDSSIIFTLNFNLIGAYSSPGVTFEDFSMALPIVIGNLDGTMVQGDDFEFLPETVNIIDTTPPVIDTNCPDNINVPTDSERCDAVVNWTPPTFSDNCDSVSVQSSHDPGDIFPVGTTIVTYTATDIGGNTVSCSFDVTVVDQESPVINCPGSVTTGTSPGVCFNNTVNIGSASGDDNCPGFNITNNAPSSFPIGTTIVTWSITDNSGNTATCNQSVTIQDNEPPMITCPADVTACSSGSVVLGSPSTSDNCGVASTTNNAPSTFPMGVTIVTWTVEDNAGNINTCTQSVTVIDNIPPTITCPADASFCDPDDVVLGSPVTNDNCGVETVTNDAPGTYPVGMTNVTWTVTDSAGNMETCVQVITIDDTPPTITCPADATFCDPDDVALGSPVTNDNCGVASVTNDAPVVFPDGVTIVTWTVTDLAGNMATCTQSITAGDVEDPTITCPPDVVECDPGAVVLGSPTVNDNCGIASVTNDAPVTFPPGVTIVTWTVTDLAGNMQTCTQSVTVDDIEFPEIICPADVVECDPDDVILGSPTVSDNCGIDQVFNDAPSSFPIGVTIVTWTVTDLAGNMETCTQTVTAGDVEDPTITCPPDVVECDPGAVVLGSPTVNDNCGIASVTNDAPVVFPDGVTIVTWTVTDLSGNMETCTQSVAIVDEQPPMISCPTVDAFDAPPGTCSVIVNNNLAPIVTDCNDFTVTYVITGATIGSGNDDATGTEFFVGTSILTYYAEDIFGNIDSCSVTVQVNDGEAPAVFCPGDQLIFVPTGTVDTIVNNIGATGNDNCTVSSLDYQTTGALTVSGSGDISGTAFPVGTTTITYIASDPSGNVDSCSFEVNVVEVLNQMLGCPLDQIVDNDPGECNAVINNIEPIVLINPGDVNSINYTLSGATTGSGTDDASGIAFNVGTTIVEYILTDNLNNMDTCSFEVTVLDAEAPTWQNCPPNITVSANLPGCEAIATWDIPLPGDNCAITQIITTFNPGDIFSVGNTAVTYIAIDAADNFGSCSFLITVVDDIAPVIDCPDNITIATSPGMCTGIATWDPIMVTDDCDNDPALVCNFNSGDAFPVGTTTVTCTATDASGNTSICTFNVTVEDDEPPQVLNCPPDLTISADQNACESIFSWTEPTFTDACSNPVSVSSTHSPGQVFQVGTTTIFYIAVDAAGNSVTCSFNLTVTDDVPPVPVCPNDITVQTSPKECGNFVTWPTPSATDNCDNTVAMTPDIPPGSFFPVGVTTVTYTALDNFGNTAICSFTVTVEDNIAPQFNCFADIVVSIDGNIVSDPSGAISSIIATSSCDSIIINYMEPVAIDNCEIDSNGLNSGLPSGAIFPTGTTTITYLAVDSSGNSANCSFDITVLPLPQVVVSINPSDTVCEGQDVVFSTNISTAGVMYSWENINTGWMDDAPEPVIAEIILADSGTYSVTITYPSGCTSTSSAELFVVEACPVDVTYNGPLCAGEDIELFVDIDASCNVESFSWVGPGFVSSMQNPVIPQATVSNSGDYTVVIEFAGGCSITRTIDVEVTLLAPPVLNAMCGTDICIGTSCVLTGTQYNPTPDAYIWEAIPVSGSGMPGNTNSNQIVVTPTLPGTYIYNYSVEINGCVSEEASVLIFVHDEPIAMADNFEVDFETSTNINVILNDTLTTNLGLSVSVVSGPSNGTLINNNNGTFSYIPNNGFIGTDQFIYEICYGCEVILCDNATVTIEVVDDRECIVPTLITPNTDGVNDELFINCLENGVYPDNELIIYNQWGHEVFRAAPYQNNWYGTYEGKDLPDGTYFYIFKLDNNADPDKGALTIFR